MVVKFFNVAIDAIFKNWSALQLAVAHQAGGPESREKAEWMKSATENWFYENSNLEKWEVEGFLETVIVNEFYVQIDDGSLYEVAGKVCDFFEICSNSDEETVRKKLLTLPKCDLSKCMVKDADDDAVAMDTTEEYLKQIEDLEISKKVRNEPEIDEDGFEMVKPKQRKNKGNRQNKTSKPNNEEIEQKADLGEKKNEEKDDKGEQKNEKDDKGEQIKDPSVMEDGKETKSCNENVVKETVKDEKKEDDKVEKKEDPGGKEDEKETDPESLPSTSSECQLQSDSHESIN